MITARDLSAMWARGVLVSRETGGTGDPEVSRETPLPELPEALWGLLEHYASLVLEANPHVNLVSRKRPELQTAENILEGLLWGISLPDFDSVKDPFLLDAGSGSGVPGIPTALLFSLSEARSQVPVFLIESREKKCDFLRHCARELGPSLLHVLSLRLEEPELPVLLRVFAGENAKGFLACRALSSVDQVLKWSRGLQPLMQEALFYKGPESAREELARRHWKKWGWSAGDPLEYHFPFRKTRLLRFTP